MVHSNSELEEKGAYYPIMKAADFALDVKQPVQTLYRQINRMRFYGPTRLQIEDRIYVTYRADLLSEVTQVTEPISISRVHADYLVLNHPTGLLGLHLYQSS